MGWVIALLSLAVVTYFVIRTAAQALELTGLSRDAARFQALSAFFGAGFTTRESEFVVSHPVRRRIIRDLIVIGNIGLFSIITSAVALIANTHSDDLGLRLGIVGGVLIALFILGRFHVVTLVIDKSVRYALEHTGAVRALDYERLLGVHHGFSVSEVAIEKDSWLDGETLAGAKLRDEGINVLAVQKPDGAFEGSPRGNTLVHAGETLIIYGPDKAIHHLAARDGGDAGRAVHQQAVESFQRGALLIGGQRDQTDTGR
jgi:TrkA-C domain